MLPITGPFTLVDNAAPTVMYRNKIWNRQKKPYDLPLAFFYTKCVAELNEARSPVLTFLVGAETQLPRLTNDAKSKAWSKFVGDVSQRAEMGVNLIEARKSVSMIATRATQLYKAYLALKRGRFGDVIRHLSDPNILEQSQMIRQKINGRHFASKSLSRQWLELHFGWTPAVRDIYSAVEILQSDFGQFRVSGKGSATPLRTAVENSNPWSQSSYSVLSVSARYGAFVEVINPNIALATKMGLTNPLSVAWELIPFSFFVDWLVNVGQFLAAFNEFLGMQLTKTYTTVLQSNSWTYHWTTYEWDGAGSSFRITRSVGLDRPGLYVMPLKRLSVQRAATAISLLIVSFL